MRPPWCLHVSVTRPLPWAPTDSVGRQLQYRNRLSRVISATLLELAAMPSVCQWADCTTRTRILGGSGPLRASLVVGGGRRARGGMDGTSGLSRP